MSRPTNRGNGWLCRRRVGFTLLELLVTISVIGVLTGLLLPAVQHARQTSRTVGCQSNLRQWALAVQYYAQAHGDHLPRRGQGIQPTGIFNRDDDWFNALPPYMNLQPYITLVQQNIQPMPGAGGVWMCPAAVDLPDPAPSTFLAYGMNMWLSTWYTTNPDRLENVGDLSTMVFMADGNGAYCSVLPSNQGYSPIARHDNNVNIAFLDGHVVTYPGDLIGCGKGDPQLPGVRWVVPDSPWPGPGGGGS